MTVLLGVGLFSGGFVTAFALITFLNAIGFIPPWVR